MEEGIRGNVFNIQRYSIHDGEGIRTVVFLKGCSLRCKWCANPESWDMKPQLFYIKSRCIGCHTCVHTCKMQEIESTSGGIQIHWERCGEDYSFVDACPTGALSVKGKYMLVDEVMKEVEKDRPFYDESNGGVTLSGGEPLVQQPFALALLKECRNRGISTAIETTGNIAWTRLQEVVPFVDLFLYDLKTMNSETHEHWTGQRNELILENLNRLASLGADIMVRTPIIPDVNDQIADIEAIMTYLKTCEIKKYDILPFHQYGSGKFESIGQKYTLMNLKAPSDEKINSFRKIIQEAGFDSVLR